MRVRPSAAFDAGVGSPLVLLHGATSAWRTWTPVLPLLIQHHRVLAPTLAGHHGGPPLLCRPVEVVPRIVDDIECRLDRAGIERAHLVGNSLGGWVALELARRGRARSVVAFSPAGAWQTPADLEKLLALFRQAALGGSVPGIRHAAAFGWARRTIMKAVAAHPERISREDVADMLADLAGCSILRPLLEGARLAGPIAPFEASADAPIRLAWAGCDRTLPFARYGRPMVAAVPHAELVMLPGVGHVPMYDNPGLVARTILEVTAGVDAPLPNN